MSEVSVLVVVVAVDVKKTVERVYSELFWWFENEMWQLRWIVVWWYLFLIVEGGVTMYWNDEWLYDKLIDFVWWRECLNLCLVLFLLHLVEVCIFVTCCCWWRWIRGVCCVLNLFDCTDYGLCWWGVSETWMAVVNVGLLCVIGYWWVWVIGLMRRGMCVCVFCWFVECLDLSVSRGDCCARAPHSWLLFHGILMTLRDECSSVLLCLPLWKGAHTHRRTSR